MHTPLVLPVLHTPLVLPVLHTPLVLPVLHTPLVLPVLQYTPTITQSGFTADAVGCYRLILTTLCFSSSTLGRIKFKIPSL